MTGGRSGRIVARCKRLHKSGCDRRLAPGLSKHTGVRAMDTTKQIRRSIRFFFRRTVEWRFVAWVGIVEMCLLLETGDAAASFEFFGGLR